MSIMDEYVKLIKRDISECIKLMFEKKATKQISDAYLETYINARYYNINPNKESNTFRTNILEEMLNTKDKLLAEHPAKEDVIENVFRFYNHIFYFDNVVKVKDFKKTIDDVCSWKAEISKTDDKDFRKNLTKIIHDGTKEANDLLSRFDSAEFYLSFANYLGINNLQRATLKYDIKFPRIYSSWALDKAFTTGAIGEDRFFVEFNLIAVQCMRDIIKGNFAKRYIVDFATGELFEKEQKKNRLLKIIDSSALQDKIALKLNYKDYKENKNDIENMIRSGFKFAIVLDETFTAGLEEIGKLNMFEFIITKKEVNYYGSLMGQTEIIKKIIAL